MSPQAARRWGTLTSATALCHMSDQLRVALGELPCRRRDNLVTRTLAKWLVVDTRFQAPPGKAPTAPEMLTTPPGAWEDDLAACVRLVERVSVEASMGVHPNFGPLTPPEWGRLAWKHLDHHLRQFGA